MKVLIVHAHPEPQSFTAALRDQALRLSKPKGMKSRSATFTR